MTNFKSDGPVVLCIMDGWGIAAASEHNAVTAASTPHFDRMMRTYSHCQLEASEAAVGLPQGQPGNSEVGHMTIGAGRIIMQDLPRIHQAVADGSLSNSARLEAFAEQLKSSGRAAHLTGLTSIGGVHAHSAHICAIAQALIEKDVTVYLHIITDGRDRLPQIALEELEGFLATLPQGVMVASVTGRYFAMDRDKRWQRTQKFIDVVAAGQSDYHAQDALRAIKDAYQRQETDEFISPTRLGSYSGMIEGDGLIMANFRVDRARQFMRAFYHREVTECSLHGLSSAPVYPGPALSMTPLADDLIAHVPSLFEPADLSQGLGEAVSAAGKKQLRIAETEKYPHVTFFFNGGREQADDAEDRYMAPSPHVATYDLAPDMSASEVTEQAEQAIQQASHDLIIVNLANPDMVGHTGSVPAAIKAVETVDQSIGRLEAAIVEAGGVMIVTADHGNCEVMWDDVAQSAHTAHTTNPVPCILVTSQKGYKLNDGGLSDLAPTLLAFLGIEQPDVMTGKSLARSVIR